MSVSIIGRADGPTSIFLAGKLGNLFLIPALIIMLLFYGIYFAKQIAGKRRGIRTNQLGRRAEGGKAPDPEYPYVRKSGVRRTELLLSAATVLIVPVEVISILWDLSLAPLPVRFAGIILGLLGDVVFLTAALTMKDSWRAGIPEEGGTGFVSQGIYSISRNPAFLGFDLMYAGILLMYFNWPLFVFTVWAVLMLHLQILKEEEYLPTVFGEEYLVYRKRTCRYLGRKRK